MKKIFALVACLSLVASLAIGGSIAYLQDQKSTVNVMTLGNVHIDQIERERGGANGLQDFSDNHGAYPVVGKIETAEQVPVDINGTPYQFFNLPNMIDKIVTVNNTGASDAYLRTIIAVEAPEAAQGYFSLNLNADIPMEKLGYVEINDGDTYDVYVFNYADALKAGESSAPSLLQVYLTSAATNDTVKALGDKWEIYVMSQAIQTQGFADAAAAFEASFGAVNADKLATWMGEAKTEDPVTNQPIHVTPATAQAAIEAAKATDVIYLEAGEYDELIIRNANGTEKTGLTIKAAAGAKVGYINLWNSDNVTLDGITFDGTKAALHIRQDKNEIVAYGNVIFTPDKNGSAPAMGSSSNTVIKDCVFIGAPADPEGHGYVPIQFTGAAGKEFAATRADGLTVEGCKFEAENIMPIYAQYLTNTLGGKLKISNNTFAAMTVGMQFPSCNCDMTITNNAFTNMSIWTTNNGATSKLVVTDNTYTTGEPKITLGNGAFTAENTTIDRNTKL